MISPFCLPVVQQRGAYSSGSNKASWPIHFSLSGHLMFESSMVGMSKLSFPSVTIE